MASAPLPTAEPTQPLAVACPTTEPACFPELDEMSIDLLFQDVSDLLGSLVATGASERGATCLAPAQPWDVPSDRCGDRSFPTFDGDTDPLLGQIDYVLRLLNDQSLAF